MPRTEQPLPPDSGALGKFAAELRLLRQKAGAPPYRELARRAHFSTTTLAEAANGRRLPSLPVTLAFVRACGGETQEWESRWREVAAELALEDAQGPGESTDDKTCPYLGLAAYGPGDASQFFGREVLTRQLVEAVRARRFVGVFGASGSGKSSLLHAGLQAWATRPEPEGPLWRCLDFTPGPHPLQQCAAQLASLSGVSAASLLRDLQTSPQALHLSVLQIMAGSRPDNQLLIVIDQFEELFTLCSEEGERQRFIVALADLAQADNSRARVVIGVRADFYAHCARYPELVELLQGAQLLVGPMTGEELRTAVSRPAAGAGCVVEAALQARVVADAAGQPAALPLVSHAMREAWRRRRGNTLTLAGYEACGGISNALARTAESTYAGLQQRQQELARRLLLRLIHLRPNAEDTKQRLDLRELDADTTEVLTALVGARLLSVDRDSVQITHEALLSAWPRLRSWIDEDRAGLLIRQQLIDAAAAWTEAEHDPGLLLQSGRLAVALEWAEGHGDDIRGASALSGYLIASRRRATAIVRARMLVIATLAVLSILATTTAAVAFQQRAAARAAQDRAVADELAGDGPALSSQDSSMAARVELASYRMKHDPNTGTDLMGTEHKPLARVLPAALNSDGALIYSPDGKVLATSGGDKTVRLWDAGSSTQLTSPLAAGEPNLELAYSPDGKLLAGSGTDAGVRLWNVSNPRHPAVLDISSTPLAGIRSKSVSFSRDGHLLATANTDNTIGVWDVTDPSHPRMINRILSGNQPVTSAVFVSDRIFATPALDSEIRLWDVNDPDNTPLASIHFALPSSGIDTVAFSPDGRIMASAQDDHTVVLWSLADPAHPARFGRPLTGHVDVVSAMAFSPDGRILAAASADRAVRLWNTVNPGAAVPLGQPLTGHTGQVRKLVFRPNGRELASVGSGGDPTVRIWTLPSTVLVGHSAPVNVLAYRPDGHVLASGSNDNTIRLWDVVDPWRPAPLGDPLLGHTGNVTSLAFRSDDKILASGSQDRTIRLWNVSDPAHPFAINVLQPSLQGPVSSLAFSPDGRTLAASCGDGTVRLWDVFDPTAPTALPSQLYMSTQTGYPLAFAFTPDSRVLTVAGDAVVRSWQISDPTRPIRLGDSALAGWTSDMLDLAFSPDGKTLAAAEQNEGIGLWNMSAWVGRDQVPQRPGPTADAGTVSVVALSPDGHTLASSTTDGTLRLWNTADPEKAVPRGAAITGHNGRIDAVVFSPDGRTVATAGDDQTIEITILDPQAAGQAVCSLTAGAVNKQRWQQYLPGVPYEDPCR